MTVDDLKALLKTACCEDIVNISETVFFENLDHIDLDGKTIYSTADPAISVNAHWWSLRNGRFRALDGICIELMSSTLGHVSGMFLQTGRPDKEIVRCIGAYNQCYDTLFQSCELASWPGMTVPTVRVSVDGNHYNSNSWQNIRFQTNGEPTAPCVLLECNIAQTWLYGNSFRDINGERPNAGLIHCRSCYGTVLDNVIVYDAHLHGGILSDDVLFFGKTPNGDRCNRTTVRNYARLGGDMAAGKYDVHLDQHYPTTGLLEQISGTGTRLRVKCPDQTIRTGVQEFLDTWVNHEVS